jgi:hypothetical protein
MVWLGIPMTQLCFFLFLFLFLFYPQPSLTKELVNLSFASSTGETLKPMQKGCSIYSTVQKKRWFLISFFFLKDETIR